MLTYSTGNTHTSHEKISEVAVDYFQSMLGGDVQVNDFPKEIALPLLLDEHKDLLAAPFTEFDVLSTLKHLEKYKCPGPDGLPVEFFLIAWEFIGTNVTNGILYFFNSLHLPRIINSSAISLIPKSKPVTVMSDYRPISRCNVLYKCISKMLTARLKLVLPAIISPCQSAFVAQRLIGDNIMLAKALCKNYHLQSGQLRCALKVDIRKAFDTLNWQFLLEAMRQMGFPSTFTIWVMKCISSCMLSVKVNGLIEGIDSWLSRCLSHTGRLQLLKVVLYGVQGYWASHIFLQKGILKKLTSYFIKFLWGGSTTSTKMVKVSWEDCCFPKEDGGLGLKNLYDWNRAAIYNQLWDEVLRYIKYFVGRNSIFLLWHDPWLDGKPLLQGQGHDISALLYLTNTSNLEKVGSWMDNGNWELPNLNHTGIIELRRRIGAVRIRQ
ncbi:hypothetical protein AgCh_001077 [Apium graveolens]